MLFSEDENPDVATPVSKKAGVKRVGRALAKSTAKRPRPPGFGGAVQKATCCKNCGTKRTSSFRNALCRDCEFGFRSHGCRSEQKWTPEVCALVRKESDAMRKQRAVDSMSFGEKLLHQQQQEILELLRKPA